MMKKFILSVGYAAVFYCYWSLGRFVGQMEGEDKGFREGRKLGRAEGKAAVLMAVNGISTPEKKTLVS